MAYITEMSLRTDGTIIGRPSTQFKSAAMWDISRQQLGFEPVLPRPVSTKLVRAILITSSSENSMDVHIERY